MSFTSEVFYGLLQENLPKTLPHLLSQDYDVHRSALQAAVRDNIVSRTIGDSLEQTCNGLQQVVIGRDLIEDETIPMYGTLLDLLNITQLSREQQDFFLNLHIRHKGTSEEFWNKICDHFGFRTQDENFLKEIQFTLQLGDLTHNCLPLVKHLLGMKRKGNIKCLRDLAALNIDDLLQSIKASDVDNLHVQAHLLPLYKTGEGKNETIAKYAQEISRTLEVSFPTAVMARKLKEENDRANKTLLQFLESNPEFDFATANIDLYLAEKASALKGIADDERQNLIQQLKTTQRLFWLTKGIPEQYEAMRKLHCDGLNSAQAIARMGQASFCARYPNNPGMIKNPIAVHAKSSQRAAIAMALFAKYSPAFNSVELSALPQHKVTNSSQNSTNHLKKNTLAPGSSASGSQNDKGGLSIPDLETLFGSFNLCECEHCRSVLSPSAYLVDLLAFLDNLKLQSSSDNKSALNVFLERRPDIERMELSCNNSDTPVPYVDLVNEVLENSVFPLEFYIKDKVADFTAQLDNEEISEELRQEFEANERSLSKEAKVSRIVESTQWSITDKEWEFIIEPVSVEGADQLKVIAKPPSAQTTGTANDLSANPEHLYVDAYEVLKEKDYPWILPFDLWVEQSRVYLEHLGVPRYQLMELFYEKSEEKKDPLDDVNIAAEYLGMTRKELELITMHTVAEKETKRLWGFTENSEGWINKLNKVPLFMERSGLSYEHLTQLLKTKYISSDQEIEIVFPEPTTPEEQITTSLCDYQRATISGLDATVLNRVHRFLRLQRKTNWSIHEFDRVVNTIGNSKVFDDQLIIDVRHICQLQNDLKPPFEELLSWYGPIDTEAGIDGELSFYERLFLNKSVLSGGNEKFLLNEERTNLVNQDQTLINEDYVPDICAALRISTHDLHRVVENELPNESELTLENLSRLFRVSSLAYALRLSIQDFLLLKDLIGIDPFDSPKETVRFVEEAHKVKEAGFSIEELEYLLLNHERPNSNIQPSQEQIAQTLEEISEGLQEIQEDNLPSPDPKGELVASKLAQLNWEDSLIKKAIALLKSKFDGDEESEDKRNRFARVLSTFEMPEREVALDSLPQNIIFPLTKILTKQDRIFVRGCFARKATGLSGRVSDG